MGRLLQATLMVPGPFYFYPWKAPINHLAGDDYDTGFKHFVTGHRHAVNIALHGVCLFIQLFGNFGLLHAIDQTGVVPQPFPGIPLLTAASAFIWAGYCLAGAPACPLVARVASAACIGVAFAMAPHVTARQMDQAAPAAMVAALLVSNFAMAKRKIAPAAVVKVMGAMAFWSFGWAHVERLFVDKVLGGELPADKHALVLGGFGLYLLALGLQRNPLRPLVVTGVIFGRLGAAAIGYNPLLSLWAYAFQASLFQGITHSAVKEEATLLALERETEERKLRFEWSHVTFFPNLAIHATMQAAGLLK